MLCESWFLPLKNIKRLSYLYWVLDFTAFEGIFFWVELVIRQTMQGMYFQWIQSI